MGPRLVLNVAVLALVALLSVLGGSAHALFQDEDPDSIPPSTEGAFPEQRGDERIVIAVIDTFADELHPALDGRVTNVETSGDDPPGDHGTSVAGIIVENAPDADVVIFTNNPDLFGPEFVELGNRELAQSIRDAVDYGVDVINVSYGFEWDIGGAFQDAVDYAWNNNVVVVMSSGNQGSASCGNVSAEGQNPEPDSALIDRAFVVGGIGTDGRLWPCANSGDYIDAAALAENVNVPVLGGGFDVASGTSFAAPVWAALAAQILEVYPGMPAAALTEMMLRFSSSATPFDELTIEEIIALRNDNVGSGTPDFDAFADFATFEDVAWDEEFPQILRWNGYKWVVDLEAELARARANHCHVIPSVDEGFSDFGPPKMDLTKLSGSNRIDFSNVFYNHREIVPANVWEPADNDGRVVLSGTFSEPGLDVSYPIELFGPGCKSFSDSGGVVDVRNDISIFVDACELVVGEEYELSLRGGVYPYPIDFPQDELAAMQAAKRCDGAGDQLNLEPPLSSEEIEAGAQAVLPDVVLDVEQDPSGNGLIITFTVGAIIAAGAGAVAYNRFGRGG